MRTNLIARFFLWAACQGAVCATAYRLGCDAATVALGAVLGLVFFVAVSSKEADR